MLGYIVPDRPELKVREFELYKGYYCGLCKTVEKRLGQLPRMVLNYDSVFLALVLCALEPESEQTRFERCPVHPVKRQTIINYRPGLDYAADMMVLLAINKLEDDRRDEGGIKPAVGLALLQGVRKKLMKSHPEKGIIIKRYLAKLRRLEKNGCISPDEVGETFARIMAEVFAASGCSFPEGSEVPLRRLGYHLGRWIYLIDAFDDIEADYKSGAYNPLIRQYKQQHEAEETKRPATAIEIRQAIRDRVRFNLQIHLSKLAEAWEDLKPLRNKNLIDNIIYSGLSQKTEQILQEGTTEHAQPL
ncbi:MAG TPA: hypothetical protein GX726_00720 [Clostridiales bacterium]|jgi:hypothetical protein|nr:hypothetical protein [Clostridiales bacterium]